MKKIFNNVGIRASIITIIINFVLFIFKLIAGIISNSNAMISDAIHSLSDVLTTIVVIFGLVIAGKEADEKHPYGHERIESVFAIVLSFFLLITGIGIGYIGIENIIKSTNSVLEIPGIFALIAAIISIIVKEGMYHYTIIVAKKIGSSSMQADAWHHRSDAMSSIGSFIGILGARLGLTILDPICSIIICLLIIKTAIEIFLGAITGLLDTSCDETTKKEIFNLIKDNKEVIAIKDLKTRMFGNKMYIDAEIIIDGNKSFIEANKIAKLIHDDIENKYIIVKHCNIQILPNTN